MAVWARRPEPSPERPGLPSILQDELGLNRFCDIWASSGARLGRGWGAAGLDASQRIARLTFADRRSSLSYGQAPAIIDAAIAV